MFVQVFPRRETYYCFSTLTSAVTWAPSFHPGRHVKSLKTVPYCHHVWAGTVNRTNRMSETFRRQTDSRTARFFYKNLTETMFVCPLVNRPCVTLPEIFSLQKYFPQKVIFSFHTLLWSCKASDWKSVSFPFPASPMPRTVKARRPLPGWRREVQC